MKTEFLNELQIKYEYLDFNNFCVFKCFEDAYLRMKHDLFEEGNYQTGLLHLEMEYYFLLELKDLLQKDKDIYDAVFLRMQPYFTFFKTKRKDLADFYSKEECEKLYQEAFSKTVQEPLQNFSFRTCLVKNLITLFKTKKNNLFTILGEYDRKYYDFLFSILTYEETDLLKRRFGPMFDGVNCQKNLSIIEQRKVAVLLNFMIEYLITLEDTIQNKNLSYEEIIENLVCIPKEEHIAFLNGLPCKEKNVERETETLYEEPPVKEKINPKTSSLEELSYLDSIIYKGYQFYGDMNQAREQFMLSSEQVLSSILNHFSLYEKEEKVKQYLYEQDAYHIRKIVTFFGMKEENFFTKKEQDYIYLLACMRQNPILTEEDILDFLSLTSDDVKDYRPMTQNDFLNDLYVYMKK
jgi:hypothetical protein